MLVEVDDVEDENLLEHLPATNRFIQQGLDGGGGVLVHWYVNIRVKWHRFTACKHHANGPVPPAPWANRARLPLSLPF